MVKSVVRIAIVSCACSLVPMALAEEMIGFSDLSGGGGGLPTIGSGGLSSGGLGALSSLTGGGTVGGGGLSGLGGLGGGGLGSLSSLTGGGKAGLPSFGSGGLSGLSSKGGGGLSGLPSMSSLPYIGSGGLSGLGGTTAKQETRAGDTVVANVAPNATRASCHHHQPRTRTSQRSVACEALQCSDKNSQGASRSLRVSRISELSC